MSYMSVSLKQKRNPGGGRPTKSGETLVVARVHPNIAKDPVEFYSKYEDLLGTIESCLEESRGKTSPHWQQAQRLLKELAEYLPQK